MTRLILATLAAAILVTPEISGASAHARSPGATTLHSYHLVAKQRALRQGTPVWQSRTGKTRQTTFIQDM